MPVDSEHSALAQCLRAGAAGEVRRLVLTASGGPFRGRRRDELAEVTPEQALAHPTWDMGPVVTTNPATMVNKGLEVIEAHELFDVAYDRIEVMVHPQSVIHSMVESNTYERRQRQRQHGRIAPSPRPGRPPPPRAAAVRARAPWPPPSGRGSRDRWRDRGRAPGWARAA